MPKTLTKDQTLQLKPWRPTKPVSKGATAYHDAVSNASYYLLILDELVKKVSHKIKEEDVIVDFGAGTGISAIQLFKHLRAKVKIWLVDNSAAWLGKAYEIFNSNKDVEYCLLEKVNDKYQTLSEAIGEEVVDHVVSANTVHLVPNLEETFSGISMALKPQGTFTFQSGNIKRDGKEEDVLLIDDTFKRVHDIAIDIVRKSRRFIKYRNDIDVRIEIEKEQRKFVFPEPRYVDSYLDALKSSGFVYEEPSHKLFRIPYKEWINFLRVKRLQYGLLPEIGGKNSLEEDQDRNELITMATKRMFKELQEENRFADKSSFAVECIYFTATKI